MKVFEDYTNKIVKKSDVINNRWIYLNFIKKCTLCNEGLYSFTSKEIDDKETTKRLCLDCFISEGDWWDENWV